MPERTIRDRLREEYFDLLPEIRRVAWQLETEIRYHTRHILRGLKSHEQLVIKSRVKTCESALLTIAREEEKRKEDRRIEGRVFDPDRPSDYSMLNLPDLAGVRALVFPSNILLEVDQTLRRRFSHWISKPVKDEHGVELASKYFGYCRQASRRVRGEYQVVPMLLGLFWEVEHSAMYKFRDAESSQELRGHRAKVHSALSRFERGIEEFARKSPL